jgi:alkanesulfonate monooxygenase SsuD/methylene tetrahydromethanopterin reductase-like flavin-dependent oxidoreductase (luciferase family)
VAALEEAVPLIRALWSPPREVDLDGRYYRLHQAVAGLVPAHPIGIWIGALGPSAFRLTGRLADGWAAPIPSYLPYEDWPDAQQTIDEAARAAGRDPAEITRIAQLVGTITDAPGPQWRAAGADPIRASAPQWAAILARLAREMRLTPSSSGPSARASTRSCGSPNRLRRTPASCSRPNRRIDAPGR